MSGLNACHPELANGLNDCHPERSAASGRAKSKELNACATTIPPSARADNMTLGLSP
jgi:hypothetical protein